MTLNPPKYKINQQSLSDFSATITAKPNLTKEEIFQKFPEFNNDADLLQSAMDYHETSKSGKYKDITELNSKFPEFEFDTEDVKKKDSGVPYSIAASEQNNLLLSGQVDLSQPISKNDAPDGSVESATNIQANQLTTSVPDPSEDERYKQFMAEEAMGNDGMKSPFMSNLHTPPVTLEQTAEKTARKMVIDREDLGFTGEIAADVSQIAPSFNKAFIGALTSIPKAVGILAKKMDDLTGVDNGPIENYSTYQLGQWIDKKALEIGITAIDDKRAGFLNSSVPSAFGSMLGMIMTGGPAAAEAGLVKQSVGKEFAKTLTSPMAFSGALQSSVPEYEAAKAAGKSDSEAFSVFLKNIPGGLTEVIPVANMFAKLNKITGNGLLGVIKSAAAQGLSQGLEEASQEAFQQYLTNQIAKGSYDPKRDLTNGVFEGASAGFVVGFLMPGIMSSMQNMSPADKSETKQAIADYLKGQDQNIVVPEGDLGVKPKVNEKPKGQLGKVDSKPLPEDIQKESVQVQEKIKEEVQSEAENVKGQSKIDKALENISKKVKPQENDIPNGSTQEKLGSGNEENVKSDITDRLTKVIDEAGEKFEKDNDGKQKTIKQLEDENKKTFPKVPVKNVFLNDISQPSKEERRKADKYIDEDKISTLPKQEINIEDIIPTQKNLTIGNLERTKDAKDSKENIVLLKSNGKFYVLDGHHRIANAILNGDKTITANFYVGDTTTKDENIEVPVTENKVPDSESETKASVEEAVVAKAEELEEKATDLYTAYPKDKKLQNHKLQEQKKDIIYQMEEVENVLWGTIPQEKRSEIRKIYKEGKIAAPFEHDALEAVQKLGYEVNDKGQVVFQVKGDGTFKIHYESMIDAIESVKKEFPEKIDSKVEPAVKHKRDSGGRVDVREKALNRGSVAKSETILNNAKDNLVEAKKAGNKKLADVYAAEVEKEQKIFDEASKINWEEVAASKEMDTNDEVQAWKEEYEKGGQKNYYNELGYYSFSTQDFMDAKKQGLFSKGHSFEEVKTLLEASEKGVPEFRKELEVEAAEAQKKLDDKFGRKDGKGYKQPTTNNDKGDFTRLQRTINSAEGKIRIIDNVLGEAAPISDKFKKFVKAVEDSGSLGEARDNLGKIKNVPAELAEDFRNTFGKKRDTIDQAVERFYNKVKSGQKLSKKEEGKAKVAKGLEGLVSKIGATKNINPLDDTSVWEDVTNIIDGLADMGIAKTEEVIDYLKKEFKKLGIKEEDVESKRGDIALYVEDKNPVKAEPNEPTALETDKSNSRKKKLLNRAFEGTENTDIAKAIENHGLTYEPETWVHAKERAQAFVEEVGYENALDAVRKNQIEDGAAAFVWSEIIDSVGEQLAETTNSEDKARLVKIEAELIDEFDRKARSGGRFISALQDVYANSDFGYKLEVQVEQYKNRNNGVISPEVEAKFKELDAQLTEAKAKRVEAEERAKKAEDELSLQNIKDSIAREKKQNTRSAQKIREAKNERAKLKSEFLSKFNPAKSGGRLNATIPGAIFIEYGVKIANTFIKEGVARLEVVYAKTKEFFDKELGYTMSDQEASDLREKIKGRIQEIDEKEGKLKIPHSLIREYVEAGAKDVNELVSKIKEDIKETHPNVTDREIRDAITGYGKTTNPSQDEVEAQIRRMVRIGRLISKLEDVAQKKRPLRSGRQRDSLDAEERALNKELISEMKGLPVDAETEAQQIKTSLDAVKARIKNQIEELNLAIETGKSVARARGISYDEEAKQLEAERDQIKEVYDAIFYKRDDDATKIENILAATDRAIEATIKKIETNDLEAKKRGQINNPDVKAAKERLSRLRDRLEQLKEEAGIPERNRLDNTKARITKQISDLKDRLETKNFAKREKPTPIIRDSELLKLDAEIARIKEEYAKEQYKVELANRTTSQKWIDGIIEAWGLSRVFKATSEMSFIMIQGWVYTINAVRDPRTAIEGLKTAFSHFASQKRADDFMNQLRAQEYYPEMKAAKLSIAEADVKLTAREEGFISAWGNHLWNFVGYVVGAPLAIWKPAYKAFTAKWKAINPLSAIERANHAYMNTLRINKYLQGREMLRKQGKNFREHPQEYKNLADVINTFTGRASLGVFDRVAKPLAVVFFSPRNWASVIKTATPVAIYHFGGMGSKQKGETTSGLLLKGKVKPSVAQKLALMDYFTAIGVTTAMVMLIDAFSDDDDIEGVSVEKDPRSSDFMKIKIGDTRVDPWGGRIQMIVLQVRMLPTLLGGGYTKNTSGQLKRLGEGFTSTRGDLLGATVKNKLSPSAAIVWDLFNAKVRHYHGEEILTNKFGGPLLIEDPENNFSPIFWETVGELYEEHPTTVASYLTFLAFLGFGVSTYSKEDQRRKASELMEMKRKEIDAEK